MFRPNRFLTPFFSSEDHQGLHLSSLEATGFTRHNPLCVGAGFQDILIEMKSTIILSNCKKLLIESVILFENCHFPRSCFLAMMAIEEAGKFSYLFSHPGFLGGPPDFSMISAKDISKDLCDHTQKALKAAALTLNENDEANRRQGRDPQTGHFWTCGLRTIAELSGWMPLRNACLYVDWDKSVPPDVAVSIAHASYMVCMGYEIVADLSDLKFEEEEEYDSYTKASAPKEIIKQLEAFSLKHDSAKQWGTLNFSNILERTSPRF